MSMPKIPNAKHNLVITRSRSPQVPETFTKCRTMCLLLHDLVRVAQTFPREVLALL
jgi:hypothetical protein